MHSIEIGSKIKKDYPEGVYEMTNQQFVDFAELVYSYQNKELSYQEFSISLTYKLMNMLPTADMYKNVFGDKIAENINKISKLNNDFFTDKIKESKKYKVIKLDFVNNLVPQILVGKKYYYGPSDAITNTEFGEYVSALNAYQDFSSTGNIEDLNRLVGTLYRPPNKDKTNLNDNRISFDKDKTAYYAKEVANVDFKYKYAIYLFFAACQNFIVTNKELEVSGGIKVDLSLLFKPGTSSEKGIGMVGVIYSLAETNVFGDAEKTAKQNTYDVLLRMMQTYYQAKKMQKNA